MDIHLHHIANGAAFQAAPVMRKGKKSLNEVALRQLSHTIFICNGLKWAYRRIGKCHGYV